MLLTNPNFTPPRHIPSDDESAYVVATKTNRAIPGGSLDSSPTTVVSRSLRMRGCKHVYTHICTLDALIKPLNIISFNISSISTGTPIFFFQHRHCNSNEDLVFLFQTPSPDGSPYFSIDDSSFHSSSSSKSASGVNSSIVIPSAVNGMMKQPRAIMRPIDQKAALGQSYCLCKALVEEHEQIWGAFRTLLYKGKKS